MNLLEEFQEARKDFIQESWDRHLIDGWMKYSNASMAICLGSFKKKYNLDEQEVLSLKRIPRTKIHFHTSVGRYIAAYLPVLNTFLWNGNKTVDQLLEICGRHDSLKYPADVAKVQSDAYELKRGKLKYQKSMTERRFDTAFYGEQKRSNWEVAKPKIRKRT